VQNLGVLLQTAQVVLERLPPNTGSISDNYLESRFLGKTIFERVGVIGELARDFGEQTALEVARKYHTKRWFSEFNSVLQKNEFSGDVFKDVVKLVYVDYLKLMPYEFKAEIKVSEMTIRCYNNCPILDACIAFGLDTKKVCCEVFNFPMQAIVSAVDENLKYERVPEQIRPRRHYCEEKIFF
jgi:hypothetical protein